VNKTANPDIVPEGLPDHLPDGERLVWQGKPDWKLLAIHAFHVRKVASYFAAIIVAQAGLRLANGTGFSEALNAVPVLIGLALAACAILLVLAYASARTTHYTLTSKRALMKVGIALPVIINIPYQQVDGVSFAVTSGNRGNIVFKTGGGIRLAYLLLWPHARPWHLTKPQPAFRDIAEVELVASRLAMLLGGQPLQELSSRDAGANTNQTGHLVAAE
jgi:Bacterial PH domain